MSIQGGGRGGGGGGGGGGTGSSSIPSAGVGVGVTLSSAASGARMNTGGGELLPRAALVPRVGVNTGGEGILPSASGHRKDTGGGSAANPCVPPQSPISAESQAEDRGFVLPFTMPTALFLRPYKPRKIAVPRVPPMKIEQAKPDPTEFSMLRNEMSALRSPLLQAFVDSATFYAEGITLRQYFVTALMRKAGDNGNRLLIKVKLPKKNAVRVKLTDEGCAVLCSWICLFTRNHAANLSWDGAFDLDSFIVLHGQVHALKPPKHRLASHSERLKDFEVLAKLIKNIFILDGQHPPYLSHLLTKLTKLPRGPLLESYRVALETHFCLLTPIGGSNALYQLKVKFDRLVGKERKDFVDVLDLRKPPIDWINKIRKIDIFNQILQWGVEGDGAVPYVDTSTSAFIFVRNYKTHVSKNSVGATGSQLFNVDGAELMVPEEFGDFVPEMWFNLLHHTLHVNLGVEEIAKNCMPSPIHVMCKRVEILNSPFMKAQGGDNIISQGKGGLEKDIKEKVTLSDNDTKKAKGGSVMESGAGPGMAISTASQANVNANQVAAPAGSGVQRYVPPHQRARARTPLPSPAPTTPTPIPLSVTGGSNGKPENAMTYEDLLMRNKRLERSVQISVVLSKHIRDLCAKVGSEVPEEVVEIEKLKEEIGVGSSEGLCPKSGILSEQVQLIEALKERNRSEKKPPHIKLLSK